ncbi:MAG: phosphatase PAP2 family protein [Flavobacteriales bacterium]|nr:phosphatase PAP2 family protein [Flavobacteriales bacterium]
MHELKKRIPILGLLFTTLVASAGEPVYQLNAKKDMALSATGMMLCGMPLLSNQTRFYHRSELASLQTEKLWWPGLDKKAHLNWSLSADRISTIIPFGMAVVVGALPWTLANERDGKGGTWTQARTIYTMYMEAWLIQAGIKSMIKTLVNRPRPFLFNPSYSTEDKLLRAEKGGKDSFISGHTSGAFMTAAFVSTVLMHTSEKKHIRWIALALAGAATVTAVQRYRSGDHYPTDILTGAFTGTLTGILVPALHLSGRQAVDLRTGIQYPDGYAPVYTLGLNMSLTTAFNGRHSITISK